jgi:glycosyltransferase involved in cell wall biosynthesis
MGWRMARPLHACFVNLSFGENSIGGVMNHMVALGRALDHEGVTVSVICPAWGEPWRYTHDDVIEVIGIREPKIDWKLAPAMLGFGWRCGGAIVKRHREKPIDLIHLHDRPPFIGARVAGIRLGVPVIYTAHSCLHSGAERYHPFAHVVCRWLERRIARSNTPIIAVSKWVRDSMVYVGASPRRTAVIHNAVDLTQFPYCGDEGRKRGEILFVGRFDHDKGFDVLLQALKQLAVTRDVKLTAAGTGDLKAQYRNLAGELGVADRVNFRGRLVDDELLAAYHSASVCVLPSRSEPFGMVMLEAMACGVPFTGTRVGGMVEVARHGETALLVQPEDPQALATVIAQSLDSPHRARCMAERARQMVERRFSWEHAAKRTRRFYDRALQADKAKG